MTAALQSPATLASLQTLSARIGKNPMLTQGAGGNTSLKADGTLWVKASGKWLEHADAEPMFVPVNLAGSRRRIAAGEADPVKPETLDFPATRGLRPSIETTLHALLPHTVVLHVHSVNTMAWAAQVDARERLGERLRDLNWAWVPYSRPGLPLTEQVAAIMKDNDPDVLIIGNHGLVVGAEDCEAAENLLRELEIRLHLHPRPPIDADLARLERLSAGSGYRLPKHPECHRMATDPDNLRIATGGSLYPDHVVFLGVGATALPADEDCAALSARYQGQGLPPPPLLLVPGAGVLVDEGLSAGGEEMVLCLALVCERISAGASVVYLNAEENAELLDWDAEKYRQSLAK